MKPKLLISFLLIVFVPLGALGWLGARVALNERKMVQVRLEELLLRQIKEIDAGLERYMETRQRELLKLTDLSAFDRATLREITRNQGFIQQAFLLDSEGRLLYPTTEFSLTKSERMFLDETAPIWESKDLFYQTMGNDRQEEQVALSQSPKRFDRSVQVDKKQQAQSISKIQTRTFDWYTRYGGKGIQLFFWHKTSDGNIVGVQLSRIRLMSDIVAQLPDTQSENPDLPNGRIVLTDSSGEMIYQWGGYEPGEKEKPRVILPLSRPLSSWSLKYYVSDDFLNGGLGKGILLNLILTLLAVGLGLMGLAIYFYRESSREIREASQRVTFVNQVSHELKTPLTNIRMYAELLDQELEEQDEKAKQQLEIIVSESQRLSRLIGNILTFSLKQRKKLKLHYAEGCVDAVIASVLQHFRVPLEGKGMQIDFQKGAPEQVSLDADALEQIMGNLIGNAEKYAASGGWLKIQTYQEETMTRIIVSDQGPGIPKSQREKIFQPFYRISNHLSEGVTGTGIGLAIARELAELHGGSLNLVPTERGACFEVQLKTPPVEPGS